MRFSTNSLITRGAAALSVMASALIALVAVAAPPRVVPPPSDSETRRAMKEILAQGEGPRRNTPDVGEQSLRHLHAGNALLWRLDLEGAAREFQVVLKTPGEFGRSAMDDYQADAARGMARVYAERGQYREAQAWLEKYRTAPGSGCGNCAESRAIYAHALRTVWSAAALQPAERADARLRRLAAGRGFRPYPSVFYRDSAVYERRLVRRASRLALAEQLTRLGRITEASPLLKALAAEKEDDSIVRLAAARYASSRKPVHAGKPASSVNAVP